MDIAGVTNSSKATRPSLGLVLGAYHIFQNIAVLSTNARSPSAWLSCRQVNLSIQICVSDLSKKEVQHLLASAWMCHLLSMHRYPRIRSNLWIFQVSIYTLKLPEAQSHGIVSRKITAVSISNSWYGLPQHYCGVQIEIFGCSDHSQTQQWRLEDREQQHLENSVYLWNQFIQVMRTEMVLLVLIFFHRMLRFRLSAILPCISPMLLSHSRCVIFSRKMLSCPILSSNSVSCFKIKIALSLDLGPIQTLDDPIHSSDFRLHCLEGKQSERPGTLLISKED